MKRFACLVLVGFAAAPPCRADLVQTSGPATLTIAFPGERPRIALADTIGVTLAIEGTPALRVEAPLDLPAGAKWILVERSKAERTPLGPQRVRWRLAYRFAPREPGNLPFQFPDVKFRDVDEADHVASWPALAFAVSTQITKLDPKTLRGVPDIEHLPPVAPAHATWPIWVALAALGCLMALAWLVWRRYFRRRIAKSPVEQARYELQRLFALKLPEQGRGERFATLLSLLIRRYLERQHQLPARRRTTAEFLAPVESCAGLDADGKQFLRCLFTRFDAVKFAGVGMGTNECREWAESVQHFLTRQASKLAQGSQTNPVEKIG